MSINNSYFIRNNTIVQNSFVNTGRNPVTEIFFGSANDAITKPGFSRFIFDLNLDLLKEKINEGLIPTGCSINLQHRLIMKNTSSFDDNTTNNTNSYDRKYATSFDLILFRIPKDSSDQPQNWDEGVGYDFIEGKSQNTKTSILYSNTGVFDKLYSVRPSNWYQTTTISTWEEPGIYNNINLGATNFDDLDIIDTQHFELGNEDIDFDMTDEINGLLDGTITESTGYGIAFLPEVENLSGLSENYVVSFFTRHTQTFYEPYLQTIFDDLVEDDRNSFAQLKENKLYLYVYDNGNYTNLDENPVVDIYDPNGEIISGFNNLTTCRKSKGIYEVTIPPITGYKLPCQFYDVWKNLKLNGEDIPQVQNDFNVLPYKQSIKIGVESKDPEEYVFDYYGILQDEKILNTDIRKVGVIIKKAYTTQKLLTSVDVYYRVYVREGQTEVQVQDWTKVNRSVNEHYFMFDTRDKIPNEYFIDIKVTSSGELNTLKRQIKFQIVNKK